MNKRIFKKIYKRAEKKLAAYRKMKDKRSYLELEKEECILSRLERKIFFREQNKRLSLVNEIIEELKAEGQ